MTALPVTTTESLTIRPCPDDVTDSLGHHPRSAYGETYWLGILGPSTTSLLRLLVTALDASPGGVGQGPPPGRHDCRHAAPRPAPTRPSTAEAGPARRRSAPRRTGWARGARRAAGPGSGWHPDASRAAGRGRTTAGPRCRVSDPT